MQERRGQDPPPFAVRDADELEAAARTGERERVHVSGLRDTVHQQRAVTEDPVAGAVDASAHGELDEVDRHVDPDQRERDGVHPA